MKKGMLLIGCALACVGLVRADAAGYVVSDVVATSRQPWENVVDISFTVTPPVGATAKIVRLGVVASNGVDEVYVSDAALCSRLVRPSGRQTIQWDAGVDHAGAVFNRLKFYVTVQEEVADTPPYMLVNLRDGSILYADHAVTNALKSESFLREYMAFRYIPPTTSDEWKALSGGSEYFVQGTPGTAEAHDAGYNFASDLDLIRERPRRVKLTKGFYLGVYPLLWGQMERLGWPRKKIGPGDSKNGGSCAIVTGLSYEEVRGADVVGGYNFSATKEVDPASLLGVLRARTGLAFDLPTEAQWEYAARAGRTNAYWFTATDVVPSEGELKWYSCLGEVEPRARPCNRWGLYGMIGSCHQWTTTLGRTTDDGAARDNFWYPADGEVDPEGVATTYAHGYRVTRGSHFRASGEAPGRDGKIYPIIFRVYRTGYRYPLHAQKPGEESVCGARFCLTLD